MVRFVLSQEGDYCRGVKPKDGMKISWWMRTGRPGERQSDDLVLKI
jgi:hypothetical protein